VSTPLDRLRIVVRETLDAGETQTALAKRLGVAQGTISGWLAEDGLDPRASVLEAVARVLGVNAHWLVTGEGEQRAMTVGAEAVFAAGYQVGLQRAEEAVRKLRATPVSDTEALARGADGREARAATQRDRHPRRDRKRGA
jgi:transcriptional regulator with XRE-family HTH domain